MKSYVLRDCGDVRPLDLRIVKLVKIIEDRHLMPSSEQFLGKMRADEPGAACHQNSHRRSPKALGAIARPRRSPA